MTSPKTVVVMIAAGAITGFGALRVAAATPELMLYSVDQNSLVLHAKDTGGGAYLYEYSPNLQDWYVLQRFPALSEYAFLPQDRMIGRSNAPQAGFYRLESYETNSPAYQAYWTRTDFLLGMKVITQESSEVLQVKHVNTSAVREMDRLTTAAGAFGIFASADEMVGYAKRYTDQTSETVLQSLTDPGKRHVLPGELQEMWAIDYGRIEVVVLRDFAVAQSGIQYRETFILSPDRTQLTSQYISFQGDALYSPEKNLVVEKKTTPLPGGGFSATGSWYDVSGGITNPAVLYTTDLGAYCNSAALLFLDIPRDQPYTSRFTTVHASWSGDLKTIIVNPDQPAKAEAPIDSYWNGFIFGTSPIGIFGLNPSNQYQEAWFDPASLAQVAGPAFATAPLVLFDFDSTSVPAGITESDGVYTFSTADGLGAGGSNALKVDYAKGSLAYPYFEFHPEPGVDASRYGSFSLLVKSLGTNVHGLIVKFEHLCYYGNGGACGAIEEYFPLLPDQWTEINYQLPWNQRRALLHSNPRLLFFVDPNRTYEAGTLLIDEVRFLPGNP